MPRHASRNTQVQDVGRGGRTAVHRQGGYILKAADNMEPLLGLQSRTY